MKNLLSNIFWSQSPGARLLLLAYVLGFPLALAGHYTHAFELYDWLGLAPALVWKGQVWRVVSYAFLPGGWIDWVVSSFWLVDADIRAGPELDFARVLGLLPSGYACRGITRGTVQTGIGMRLCGKCRDDFCVVGRLGLVLPP